MSFISDKIKKIMKEGVRRNTRKPVGKSNPRRKVSQKRAVAIAYSMDRQRKLNKAKSKKAIYHKGKRVYG